VAYHGTIPMPLLT